LFGNLHAASDRDCGRFSPPVDTLANDGLFSPAALNVLAGRVGMAISGS